MINHVFTSVFVIQEFRWTAMPSYISTCEQGFFFGGGVFWRTNLVHQPTSATRKGSCFGEEWSDFQKLMKMVTMNDLINAHSQINALYLINALSPPPPRCEIYIRHSPLINTLCLIDAALPQRISLKTKENFHRLKSQNYYFFLSCLVSNGLRIASSTSLKYR